jgi:D-serine deaminase-like pyridoxal phosphate-dependent protein
MNYQTYKTAIANYALPLAYVDLDLFDENVQQVLQRARELPVRIASKSVRSVPLLQRLLAAHQRMRGVLCYSVAEAVQLSRCGLDDLLIAYPSTDRAGLAALCNEVRLGKTIVPMVDCHEHVALLGAIAAAQHVVLPICIDLDLAVDLPGLHFGTWRSALRSSAQVRELYQAIERCPQLRLDGLMGYEGQIAGVGDAMPGQALKNRVVRLLKAFSIRIVARRRAAAVIELHKLGASLRFVNGGGTGSLESTSREAAVSEVAVGSAFFAPGLFDLYNTFRHLPAAGFAVAVSRRPRPHILTCAGAGYVASGSAGPEKLPQPYLPRGARLTALEGAGEVQTPVLYNGPLQLALGDPIFFRHSKAGELCEHFNELHLIQGGTVVEKVKTYRGEGWAF